MSLTWVMKGGNMIAATLHTTFYDGSQYSRGEYKLGRRREERRGRREERRGRREWTDNMI